MTEPHAGSDLKAIRTRAVREALRVGATVGEVCGVLRDSWGTHDAGRAR